MRRISARPEQKSLPNTPTSRFPLFERAGRNAAELWLIASPLSMADFRDLRFRNLIAGDPTLDHFEARRATFNSAFTTRIAQAIVRAEVCRA